MVGQVFSKQLLGKRDTCLGGAVASLASWFGPILEGNDHKHFFTITNGLFQGLLTTVFVYPECIG